MPDQADQSAADREALLDAAFKSIERAERASNRVLVRWLFDSEVPLLTACVLFAVAPNDTPISVSEVAEEIGISVDDAASALHELRLLGFAEEDVRRYMLTDAGRAKHESLARAQREAFGAFMAMLSEDERDVLARALTD